MRAGVLLAFLSGVQASDLCTGLGEYAKGSCNCDAGFKGERCDQLYVVDVFTDSPTKAAYTAVNVMNVECQFVKLVHQLLPVDKLNTHPFRFRNGRGCNTRNSHLGPAPSEGALHLSSSRSSWGGRPIKIQTKYHLFGTFL